MHSSRASVHVRMDACKQASWQHVGCRPRPSTEGKDSPSAVTLVVVVDLLSVTANLVATCVKRRMQVYNGHTIHKNRAHQPCTAILLSHSTQLTQEHELQGLANSDLTGLIV